VKNNIIDIKRVESSPTEPITLAEAKAQMIITYTDDDSLITDLITQARKAIENYCIVSIVVKTITLVADLFNEWELPYGPVTGLQSVAVRSGTQGSGPASYTTAENWAQDGVDFITFIPPDDAGTWDWGLPRPRSQWPSWFNSRYKIIYTAGPYCPDDLKLAILQEISFRYQNRGDASETRVTQFADLGVCVPARVLADPYVRQSWQ
jgi:hypothetical protein